MMKRSVLRRFEQVNKELWVLEIKQHVAKGVEILEPVGGSLRRVIPIILAHHDKFDGSGYHPTSGEESR